MSSSCSLEWYHLPAQDSITSLHGMLLQTIPCLNVYSSLSAPTEPPPPPPSLLSVFPSPAEADDLPPPPQADILPPPPATMDDIPPLDFSEPGKAPTFFEELQQKIK